MGDSPLESTHSGFWLRSEARINFRNSVKLRILSDIAVGKGLSLALSAGGGAVSGSRSIQLHGNHRASTEAVNGTKVPVRGFDRLRLRCWPRDIARLPVQSNRNAENHTI